MDTIHRDIPAAEPEIRDANIPLVVWTTIGILVSLIFCMLIAAFQFRFEQSQVPKGEPSVFSHENQLPPEPRLQANPGVDQMTFQARQKERAESFGWVDKDGGIAHVPVEKGMEMILKNGLPEVLAKPANPKPGTKNVPAVRPAVAPKQ
ncbi:MAG TPA: hypothetical protein VM120_27840 [Bryobacteraceae bacterium]|nr:hypothetical protein [Bryobacteraceae bacterium]